MVNIAFLTYSIILFLPTVCVPDPEGLDYQQVTHGFSPFLANLFEETGNPGYTKGKIFHHHCTTEGGKPGHYNYLTVHSDLNCQSHLQVYTYKSYWEYCAASVSSVYFGQSVYYAAEAADYGFYGYSAASVAVARQDDYYGFQHVFLGAEGEISVAFAKCFTHNIAIGEYTRPRFTPNFIQGLADLNKVATDASATDEQKADHYKKFTVEFGTHYVKQADMGAFLLYQKIFQKRSKSYLVEQARSTCFAAAVEACVAAEGYENSTYESAQVCVGTYLAACDYQYAGEAGGLEETAGDLCIITKGSRPKSLMSWADSVFQPAPIFQSLGNILELITKDNLAISEEYGIDVQLDAGAIRTLIEDNMVNYCTMVLGEEEAACHNQLRGCGLSGYCGPDELCQSWDNEVGFICLPKEGIKLQLGNHIY